METSTKKAWITTRLVVISRKTDINGGADPAYNESTILGSQHGANPITFTLPASKSGHAYTRNHYLS